MRKKRNKSGTSAEPPEPKPVPPPPISTSLKGAIAGWKQREIAIVAKPSQPKAKPTPPVTLPPPGPSRASLVPIPPLPPKGDAARKLSKEDQNALERAFAGVQPLTERKRGGPSATVVQAGVIARTNEVEARSRLDALVGGAVRIHVERDDNYVNGLRDGVPKTALRRLRGASLRPEATLDLHGERAADAGTLVSKFVRMQHKKGLRLLLIIHGKGQHSEHGVGVLGDKVVSVLSEGGAAPLIAAFTTAHADHGGTGALMVELVS